MQWLALKGEQQAKLSGVYAYQGSRKKYSQNHSVLNKDIYPRIDLTMNINNSRLYQVNERYSLYQVSSKYQFPYIT